MSLQDNSPQASHVCFEVKSEKLSQVAVGLSEPETVTPTNILSLRDK